MEGEREYSPPFWPQPQRRPSPSFSSGLRPWVLVLLSSIFIILFLPAFLSSSSSSSSSFRGLRPGNLIRNGWDTLNLCLVLFAILCGLLGRSNGDEADKSPRSAEWPAVGYSAPPSVQNGYGDPAVTPTAGIRRMRSSSSYPDLRQEAMDAWGGAAEAWRFSDDIQLYHRPRRSEVEAKTIPLGTGTGEGWRFSDDIQLHHRGRRSENNHREWERTTEGESKTIPVDTFILRKSPPRSRSPPPTPSPPPPPPPPPQRHSRGRSVHELPEKEEEQEAKMEEEKTQLHSPVPPPPPPPPPSPLPTQEQKRSQKKKSVGGAKDIATAISLFYNKKRKKGSNTKTKKVHDDTSHPANAPASPQSPPAPPPPPPPPPPSSVFYQLFSPRKGGSKSRKIHSTPPFPPPPLPPQPATLKRRSEMHASAPPPPPPPHPTDKSSKEASRLPPAPQRVNLYDKREKTNLSRFSLPPSSPLLPPPPPPPLPSDLQLLLSEEEILVDGVPGGGDGGGGGTAGEEGEGKEGVAVFCPSPDVNNKADLFIARFRAGLKLEKLNSLREKQRRQQQEEQQQEEEFMMERGVFDNDSAAPGCSKNGF